MVLKCGITMTAVGRLLSIADIFSVCFEEVKIASMGKQAPKSCKQTELQLQPESNERKDALK